MGYSITRYTTPTINLKIQGSVKEGCVPVVTVMQDNEVFSPEASFDRNTNTVSFKMTSEQTGAFEAGSRLYIQLSLRNEDGSVETCPMHDVLVEEMLYVPENDPKAYPLDGTMTLTEDTSFQDGVEYYEQVYSNATVSPYDIPIDMGYYEFYENAFHQSQDQDVVDGKDYYIPRYTLVQEVPGGNPSSMGLYVYENRIGDVDISGGEEHEEVNYIQVTPSQGDVPADEGWLEIDGCGLYVVTSDISVVSGKTYYTMAEDDHIDNIDSFYYGFDKEAVSALLGLESIDDMDFSEGSDDISYVTATPAEGDNPSDKGWFELVSGSYIQTSDTTVVSGKTYYEIRTGEWTIDDDSTGGYIPSESVQAQGYPSTEPAESEQNEQSEENDEGE